MPGIDPDHDAECFDALAESLRNVCADYPDHLVRFELVARLGETVGHFPLHERNLVLNAAEVELRHYVSEIPPPASDDRESRD